MSPSPDLLPSDSVHSGQSPGDGNPDNPYSTPDVIKVQTGEQFKQYLKIRFDVFIVEQGIDPSLEIDEYDGGGVDIKEANKKAIHFLALADGIPAGTGRLILRPGEVCKATRIATAPQFRKMGIGRAIMLAIHEEATNRGYKFCKLGAQLSAIPFYQRLNYGVIPPGDDFLDAGIPHQWMQVKLD